MDEGIREVNEDLPEHVKEFAKATTSRVNKLHRKQCSKCFYFGKGAGDSTCDYIHLERHSRGCNPFDCVKEGIFKPADKKARRKAWKAVMGDYD